MVKMCHILKLQNQYQVPINNDYQQDSRVVYTFDPNKPFGTLLDISPKNHIIINSEFQAIEV